MTKRKTNALQLATLMVILLSITGEAMADLSTQFGLSPRAIGMGNAVSAVIDDYSGVYYNPAALSTSPSNSFTFGYFYTTPRIKVRQGAGPERLAFDTHLNAGVMGYRQNLRGMFPKKWGRNIIVALGLVFPGNFKKATFVSTSFYDQMQFPVFGRTPDMLVMSGGLSLEVLPRTVFLGMGMRFAVTYDANNIDVYINVLKGQNTFRKVDVNAETEVLPIAGFLFQPLSWLRLAGVWRKGGAPVRIVGKGGGVAQVGPIKLPINLSLNFQDFYSPDEYAGSVACWPIKNLLVALEFTYARWSKYDDPYGQPPPGDPFHDILIPRLGIEYQVLDSLRVDVGYYWQPSPVSSVQPSTQYLDADEHVFACAVEYALAIPRILRYPLRFYAYAQYQYLPERTLQTVNGPTSVWGYITNVGGTIQLSF